MRVVCVAELLLCFVLTASAIPPPLPCRDNEVETFCVPICRNTCRNYQYGCANELSRSTNVIEDAPSASTDTVKTSLIDEPIRPIGWICRQGCICRDGYVLSVITGECIQIRKCTNNLHNTTKRPKGGHNRPVYQQTIVIGGQSNNNQNLGGQHLIVQKPSINTHPIVSGGSNGPGGIDEVPAPVTAPPILPPRPLPTMVPNITVSPDPVPTPVTAPPLPPPRPSLPIPLPPTFATEEPFLWPGEPEDPHNSVTTITPDTGVDELPEPITAPIRPPPRPLPPILIPEELFPFTEKPGDPHNSVITDRPDIAVEGAPFPQGILPGEPYPDYPLPPGTDYIDPEVLYPLDPLPDEPMPTHLPLLTRPPVKPSLPLPPTAVSEDPLPIDPPIGDPKPEDPVTGGPNLRGDVHVQYPIDPLPTEPQESHTSDEDYEDSDENGPASNNGGSVAGGNQIFVIEGQTNDNVNILNYKLAPGKPNKKHKRKH